ncbi:unnamed protein product [Prorocentrum cordatum]|uniref:Reverse transcriptase domain-containing protein n=1 Tax=Prorocentrum cordatum TaxID=2364126 RepID=A0ABN9S5M1_9DINO|nr:unnamed protein product [Polarella glacialis]
MSPGAAFVRGSHEGRVVNRDLLPLPHYRLPSMGSDDGGQPKSRRGQRRRGERAHCEDWARCCAITLNELDRGSADPHPQGQRASAGQERSLGMIQAAVAELGRPPADLTRQGALAGLLAKRSYTGEKVSAARLDISLLSLPAGGDGPRALTTLLGDEGPMVVDAFLKDKVLPPSEAAARVAESALKRPYYDPSLQGRPRRYARLLVALDGAGMLEWRRRGSPRVGLFTVWKKNGKQRLIVDARLSNLCFASPDPVDLATGGSFASLEVDPGPPVCLAQVDIQDAFYHLLLPPELVPFFCLRPVTAGLAGVVELDGAPVSPTQLVYPHLRVVPMGWNRAMWWCQRIHEFHAFRQPGVSLSNKLSDKKPGVRLGRSGFAHTEYVDNFAAIGRQAKEVDAVADSVLDALTAAGLSMHPRESSVGGSVLGWEFSDECPQVRVSPRRAWRLRLGIEGLLEKGFATGRDLEAIIGHFTFAARIRPEALCVFSAAYAFSQRGELNLAAAAGLDDLDRLGTARHLEALGEVDRSGAVPEIGPEILQGSWTTVSAGRWKRRWAMPILEGRALVWGVRHVSRGLSEFGKRILFLTDGLSEVLALEKGRSSSVALMRVCRQWAATVFAADLYPRVRWIRSELNVADEPSRRYQPKPFGLKPGCFRPPPGLPEPDGDRPPAATRRCPDPVGPVGCGPGDRQPGEAGRGCGAATRPGRAADPVASGGAVTGWCATAPTPWAGPGKGSGETSQASARGAGHEGGARRCPANEFPRGQAGDRQQGPLAAREGERGRPRPAGLPVGARGVRDLLRDPGPAPRDRSGRRRGSRGVDLPRCLRRQRRAGGDKAQGAAAVLLPAAPVRGWAAPVQPGAEGVEAAGVAAEPAAAAGGGRLRGGTQARGKPGPARRPPRLCELRGRPAARGADVADRAASGAAGAGGWPHRAVASAVSDGGEDAQQGRRLQQERAGRPAVLPPHQGRAEAARGRRQRQGPRGAGAVRAAGAGARHGGPAARPRGPAGPVPAAARRSARRPGQLPPQHRGGEGSQPLGKRQLGDGVRQRRPRRRPADQVATAVARPRRRPRQEAWRHPLRALPAFAARAGGAVALEVFSGSGNFSRAWRRRQRALGYAIFEWDIRWGEEYDLTRQRTQRLVRGWVNNGLIAAVWLGTPCHSWSRARDIRPGPPPLRSDLHVMGLPDLAPRDAEKVRIGNAHMKFSASLFSLCQAVRVPVAIENPHMSRIWLTSQFRRLQRKCRSVVLDFCQFGQSCRKRTRIIYDHVDLQPLHRLCRGPRGICSRTGRPHDQLQGKNADGIFHTLLAEAYPADLCTSIVRCFQLALAEKKVQRVQTIWCG